MAPDPQFFVKAAEVCTLYRNIPPRSVVLSVDEKTAMAAHSRKHHDRLPGLGRVRRREFEYVRHGTVSVTAAPDVHTGKVVVEELPRSDSAHFIAFLARLERGVPAGLTIHLVLDNGSSHPSKVIRAWLAKHPRIVAHYTPKYASWLNQVEIFISLMARAVLRHGDFSSRDDLLGEGHRLRHRPQRDCSPVPWELSGPAPPD
ncbi:IS630 family transposase [[Kitasatospora] papulosa]|uniref:IS630 family transposase n=1 Tax=[Kitasatospora] papulosa TaxID=1464011 RepID=UPI0036BB3D65